jgi:hypothetical protein
MVRLSRRAAASPIEAFDLAIDDGVVRLDRVREFFTQLRPVLERMTVAPNAACTDGR